jgi:hypothetical protein
MALTFQALEWLLALGSPVIAGALGGWLLGSPASILVPAGASWLVFLALNLFGEQISPDRELVQGSWPYVQAVGGTVVVAIAMGSSWLTTWAKRKWANDHV